MSIKKRYQKNKNTETGRSQGKKMPTEVKNSMD